MKSRNKTWEVIAAGCAFMALSVYLFNPVDTITKDPIKVHKMQIQVPNAPEPPTAPPEVTIDLQKLEKLEKLKELEHVEQELQKVEKELEKVSIQLNMDLSSLTGLHHLPKILIHSN
ncbi:hypothetical protein [Fodinibius salsisoli]|uniref:Uncharacterized protein n=1 Tax=Fodinibius salsisoli TaxID=2820877 RepID=A0ABT3PP12_9BACT|nr:hypothetical protein [Fodinibius salsisoli]MCW9707603.1 hypothetical protein [Fodinibius salsisoli]